MDQCITKYVIHVYTMDTRSILCCNNMTVASTYFTIQQTRVMNSQVSGQCLYTIPPSVWSMFVYNTYILCYIDVGYTDIRNVFTLQTKLVK